MIPPRRVLEFLLGAACAVLIIAGMRSASGILNPMLMAGFLALLLQPLTRKLRRWGMAGGAAVALVVLSVVLAGITMVAFVGVSLRQIALDFPVYRTKLEAILGSLSQWLEGHGVDAVAYVQAAIRGPEVGRSLLGASGAVALCYRDDDRTQ